MSKSVSLPVSTPVRRQGPAWYRRWSVWRRMTALAFLGLLMLGSWAWMTPYFLGSTSGTRVLDLIPLTDPLAAIESIVAARQWRADALIGAGILLAFAVLVGPIFCAWVCPLGLVLDVNDALRRKFRRRFFGSRQFEPVTPGPSGASRVAVLGAFLGFALIAQLPMFQIISPINLFVRGLVFGSSMGILFIVSILIAEWAWPRLWCRRLCPLGALYGLVGRFGLLRVQINPAEAGKVPCRRCSSRCPMGVPIMDEYTMKTRRSITHPHCTRCGDCTQVCPRGVLKLSFLPFRNNNAASESCDNPGDDCACGGHSLPVLHSVSS